MDVVLVRWPDDADRREVLSTAGVPRLLLVREGVDPPSTVDCLEDWIRVPADERDVRFRADSLTRRRTSHTPDRPDLDEHGVLRFRGRWVPLPPVEARLTAALLDRLGAVVSREALSRAGWPAGAGGRNALDVHVLRLRRRLDGVGLAIRTVRARGYLLEPANNS